MTNVNEQIPSYSFSFLHAFFFFLELSCVTSFFFFSFQAFFFSFLFFFWSCAVSLLFSVLDIFPFLSGGRRICSSCFWSLFLVSYFLGPCVFSLSLSLDRLNKPLRNRFLLVLSRFSDRLRGTMVTQSKTISWTICPSSGTKYVYVPYSQLTVCAK